MGRRRAEWGGGGLHTCVGCCATQGCLPGCAHACRACLPACLPDAVSYSPVPRTHTATISYDWIDEDTIVAAIVPPGLGPAPRRPVTPLGPKIEDNSSGRKSQARTYPDLLQGPYDEQLFEHYCESQLVTVKVRGVCVRVCWWWLECVGERES